MVNWKHHKSTPTIQRQTNRRISMNSVSLKNIPKLLAVLSQADNNFCRKLENIIDSTYIHVCSEKIYLNTIPSHNYSDIICILPCFYRSIKKISVDKGTITLTYAINISIDKLQIEIKDINIEQLKLFKEYCKERTNIMSAFIGWDEEDTGIRTEDVWKHLPEDKTVVKHHVRSSSI